MYPDLLFGQQEQYEDLSEQFAEYTVLDLQSNLLKLIQTNIVYSYCESLIVEDVDCAEQKVAQIITYCQEKNQSLLYDCLPFHILLKLKKAKKDVSKCDRDRQTIIAIILNIIVENTLLRSTLTRFADLY